MNLLLLGGEGPHNKPWIHQVKTELAPLFDACMVHEYEHWDGPSKSIDLTKELARLGEKIDALGEYSIFAKSAGAVLALKGIAQGTLSPHACLFAGLPLGMLRSEHIDAGILFRSCEMPISLLQNDHDPVGSYANVKAYLLDAGTRVTLFEGIGNTHNYTDFTQLKELATRLI
jgi:hypothetical protein